MKWRILSGLFLFFMVTFFWSSAQASKPSIQNRLAKESSPYLQLHADNPVDWYPWGKPAFDKAKRENKPIFLSIGYSTCYWCHVMERESFSDPKVAKLMNRYFVNIKVDREERPDVDEIYITSLQIMNGHSGWPISIWLTPDLKPFFGGVYFPKDQFISVMEQIHKAWKDKQQAIINYADRVTVALKSATQLPSQSSSQLPNVKLIAQATRDYTHHYDTIYGGFPQSNAKFPQVPVLQLLLVDYEQYHNKSSLQMVEKTLNAMLEGGIHDQVGGGLHRYATDLKWDIPHFEKMLYDQAQALMVYAQTYQVTQNPNYRQMANGIVRYLQDKLLSPEGLFYSAEDAETNQSEGQTYVWTNRALQKALTSKQWRFVKQVYDLQTKYWGEGKHHYQGIILRLKASPKQLAKQQRLSLENFYNELNQINKTLLQVRHKRVQPRLDDKIITAWNGLTIEALANAGRIFKQPKDIALAKQAGEALWTHLHSKTVPLYHVMRYQKAKLPAYLDDYAATILGFTALYQTTDDKIWLRRATVIADAMIKKLKSPSGNFYYVEPQTSNLLTHQQFTFDGAMPSGNSLAVRALISLARESGNLSYAKDAARVLAAYHEALGRSPQMFPTMLWGLFAYHQLRLNQYADKKSASRVTDNLHSSQFVHMKVVLSPQSLNPHKINTLKVLLSIDKGWHINANPASLKFLIPTEVKIKLSQGKLRVKTDYPRGEKLRIGLDKPIAVYSKKVMIPSTIRWMKNNNTSPKQSILTVSTIVQACNDKGRCLLPDTLTRILRVTLRME